MAIVQPSGAGVTGDLQQRQLWLRIRRMCLNVQCLWLQSLIGSTTVKCLHGIRRNWSYFLKFYLKDSIYTERYMGLPTPGDNEIGYVESDVCRMAENFRKKFYFVNGTADDNVHYQQTSRALEAADALFRQQVSLT